MIALLSLILLYQTGDITSNQSLVIDSSAYLSWDELSITIFDRDGTILSRIKPPADFTCERMAGQVVVKLSRTDEEYVLTSDSGKYSLVKQSPVRASLSDNQLRIGSSPNSKSFTLPTTDATLERSDLTFEYDSDFGIGVLNVRRTVQKDYTYTNLSSYVIHDDSIERVASPFQSTLVTHVTQNHLYGAGTNERVYLDGRTPLHYTLSPFIFSRSTGETQILKHIQPVVVKPRPGEDPLDMAYDGAVQVIPMSANNSGTLVLCNRIQYGPKSKHSSVILFKQGQVQVIESVVINGMQIRPIRVKDSRGSLAILEGTDSKGKTVAFTYHLR